jgi:hypothetical protein
MAPLESSEVMLPVVAPPMIIILMTLEVSFMLLDNIIVQASFMMIVNYNHHIFKVKATGAFYSISGI